MKIKLTKIKELDDAEVPNNIPVNDFRIGTMYEKPIVGKSFAMSTRNMHAFITSPVTEVIDEFTFKTLNSIYKIEILE